MDKYKKQKTLRQWKRKKKNKTNTLAFLVIRSKEEVISAYKKNEMLLRRINKINKT